MDDRLIWKTTRNNEIPSDAWDCGCFDASQRLFVARAPFGKKGIHPGKIGMNMRTINVPYEGRDEPVAQKYEVLCGAKPNFRLEWRPWNLQQGPPPPTMQVPVAGHDDGGPSKPLYIARAWFSEGGRNSVIPGKAGVHLAGARIAFLGKEYVLKQPGTYELLCLVPTGNSDAAAQLPPISPSGGSRPHSGSVGSAAGAAASGTLPPVPNGSPAAAGAPKTGSSERPFPEMNSLGQALPGTNPPTYYPPPAPYAPASGYPGYHNQGAYGGYPGTAYPQGYPPAYPAPGRQGPYYQGTVYQHPPTGYAPAAPYGQPQYGGYPGYQQPSAYAPQPAYAYPPAAPGAYPGPYGGNPPPPPPSYASLGASAVAPPSLAVSATPAPPGPDAGRAALASPPPPPTNPEAPAAAAAPARDSAASPAIPTVQGRRRSLSPLPDIPPKPLPDRPRAASAGPDAGGGASTAGSDGPTKMPDCIVCMDKPVGIVFIPCGHLCCCRDCANDIKEFCPMCRQKFTMKQKIFADL